MTWLVQAGDLPLLWEKLKVSVANDLSALMTCDTWHPLHSKQFLVRSVFSCNISVAMLSHCRHLSPRCTKYHWLATHYWRCTKYHWLATHHWLIANSLSYTQQKHSCSRIPDSGNYKNKKEEKRTNEIYFFLKVFSFKPPAPKLKLVFTTHMLFIFLCLYYDRI